MVLVVIRFYGTTRRLRHKSSCKELQCGPAASVSGVYFAHPEARYFAVDMVTRDQVESYAARKGMGVKEMERWLGPNLAYEAE